MPHVEDPRHTTGESPVPHWDEGPVFEARLKIALTLFSVVLLVVIVRLVELQVVRADHYRQRAEEILLHAPQTLPFARGRIVDRTGEELAFDKPCWEICVDYSVIALEPDHVKAHVRRWKRAKRYPAAQDDAEVEAAFRTEVEGMWLELAAFDHVDKGQILERAGRIHQRIQRIHRSVSRYWGFDREVREERLAHAVITSLPNDDQIKAREQFRKYPWVHVRSSTVRAYRDAEPFAHLLGRLGAVDQHALKNDPDRDDEFARYLGTEVVGVSGVEKLAERRLRGRRGQLIRDRNDEIVPDGLIEPVNGEDVRLTIRADLQRRLYALLGEAAIHRRVAGATATPEVAGATATPEVAGATATPEAVGGSIVVLDAVGREVLALVSYPSYDPNAFRRIYADLRDQTQTLPLRFRAVSNMYAPGSIVKPLVCLAGLDTGRITLDTQETCTGYLFPDNPNAPASKCWQIHGTNMRKAHGTIDVVGALRGSCNIFMYHLGQKLGVDTLCSYFDMVGFGRATGIGLREEAVGLNPTPGWMAWRGKAVTPGINRLLAIGQGDLLVTPLQAANLTAVYAGGKYRPIRLLKDDDPPPEWTLPGAPHHWAAIRQGMYEVVNHQDGTAYKYAYFEHDGYALCGKTGSASVYPRPTEYTVRYKDEDDVERVAHIPAGSRSDAKQRFEYRFREQGFEPTGFEVSRRWPANVSPDQKCSHAWFTGYLQAIDSHRRPIWSKTPRVAFAVMLEYGGSGGRTSGPVGREVARILIETLGPNLDPDAPPQAARQP